MLIQAVAALFKFKVVGSIIVLTCWPALDICFGLVGVLVGFPTVTGRAIGPGYYNIASDSNRQLMIHNQLLLYNELLVAEDCGERVRFVRELFKYDLIATFSCEPELLEKANINRLQGVLYIPSHTNLLYKVRREYFSNEYKWIIVSESVPDEVNSVRYDADILLIKQWTDEKMEYNDLRLNESLYRTINGTTSIEEVYIHPKDGASTHPWAYWTSHNGLQVLYDKERVLRRRNLAKYPLKIATPLGSYSEDSYNGTFLDYLMDMSIRERDSGIRSGYTSSALIIEMLNATEVLVPTMLWGSEVNNSSMILELKYGSSELSGGILRMLPERLTKLDYVLPIWPFQVGFTYVAERASSSNMFLEPFTMTVWLCCLGIFLILALAQRITANTPMEKEGAYIATLATYMQQDASAVPEGMSGRWTFLVLSISAMLIHAYYTSAIVSALMSAGRSGPDSLRSLGDSKYAIASEDYDYMRYLMFDVKTNWDDLEYLKKKKLTSRFYQDINKGVQLIKAGQTAYHTEYNQLYPHLKTFTDDQLCKLQYVDTIPEVLTWVTTTRHGQWTGTFRIAGAWQQETGLTKRFVSRLRIRPPPCRAALLAERVNISDIGPVLIITLAGVLTSFIFLGIEIIISRLRGRHDVSSQTIAD